MMNIPQSDSSEKKKVCIISFSEIDRDARVLRQIEYLHAIYRITVIGIGKRPKQFDEYDDLTWVELFTSKENKFVRRLKYGIRVIRRFISRLLVGERESFLESRYWTHILFSQAIQYPKNHKFDLIHANDWESLPIAAEASKTNGAKILFDAHEYAPSQFETQLLWRLTYKPMILHLLHKYKSYVDIFVTVEEGIGKRYKNEYGWNPLIIRNIPKLIPNDITFTTGDEIKIVHHGGANPDRKLETMIRTIALCDERFHLYFMLIDKGQEYIKKLKTISDKIAPGRVTFLDPVPHNELITALGKFDLGMYILEPTNFNFERSLPNKLFDFISAGLGVVIGPSPAMANIVNDYQIGCVSSSFLPKDVANVLNHLDRSMIDEYKKASINAKNVLNSDIEMAKLVDHYQSIISS